MSFDQDQNESVTISGADFSAMCDEIKNLSAQRDELLDACQDFVNAVRAGSKQEIMLAIDAADKKARAAIAKTKGKV